MILGSEHSLKQSEFTAAWVGSGDKEIGTIFAVLNLLDIGVLKKILNRFGVLFFIF